MGCIVNQCADGIARAAAHTTRTTACAPPVADGVDDGASQIAHGIAIRPLVADNTTLANLCCGCRLAIVLGDGATDSSRVGEQTAVVHAETAVDQRNAAPTILVGFVVTNGAATVNCER